MTNEPFITKEFYSVLESNSEAICLSLFISSQSFKYVIFNREYSIVLELCDVHISQSSASSYNFADQISMLLTNHQLQNKKFEKVNVSILNSDFTIIPNSFSDSIQEKNLLQFATATQHNHTLRHETNNIKFIYACDNQLVKTVERLFPHASIKHSGAVCINLFFSHRTLSNQNLFLNIEEGVFELAIKSSNTLLFYNVFNYNSNEDILYYMLFAIEQFSINPQNLTLVVAGQRSASDTLLVTLRKYFKNIEYCISDFKDSKFWEKKMIPHHYYFTLLNQHLCEL